MGLLTLSDVSVRFAGLMALDRVSVDVTPGSVHGVIGPNGAGKTTLFNCVSRLYTPFRGSIEFDGISVLDLDAHEVAAIGIARTFQNLALFPELTVAENVMVGATKGARPPILRDVFTLGLTRRERARRAGTHEVLAALGLGDLADAPCRGQPFGTLKRIELARALAARPRLLLLDEPAGGLTHEEVAALADLIRTVVARFDITVMLVEHHMGMVMSLCDQVTVLDFGRVIASGTPSQVRDDPTVVAAYLGGGEHGAA